MLYKICYVCGAKEKQLIEGRCEKCFKEEVPPVEEIKPLNLKICNSCGKVHFKNSLYTIDEIENILPDIIKENIVLSSPVYVIDEIEIENFNVKGNKISFDIGINTHMEKE